jgi:hypothetical protein
MSQLKKTKPEKTNEKEPTTEFDIADSRLTTFVDSAIANNNKAIFELIACLREEVKQMNTKLDHAPKVATENPTSDLQKENDANGVILQYIVV